MVRIVIIGGGYAGVSTANNLEKNNVDAEIVLVEPKGYFYHNIASVRATVNKEWIPKSILSTDKLFKKPQNKILQTKALEIHQDKVLLASNPVNGNNVVSVEGNNVFLTFDYLVVAIGSSYSSPFKFDFESKSDIEATLLKIAERIKKASNVVIVGAGPVGLETAGEISHLYPEKSITIVTSSETIIPGPYPDKMRQKLLKMLDDKKIKLICGARVTSALDDLDSMLQSQILSLDNGNMLETDIVIKSVGSGPAFSPLKFSLESVVDSKGFVKVDQFLQVEGYSNIFCVGDVSSADTQKLSFLADIQASTAVKNIKSLIQAKQKSAIASLAVYKAPGSNPAMFVTFGPENGAGVMPFWNLNVGSFLTKNLKGKDMFLKQFSQARGH